MGLYFVILLYFSSQLITPLQAQEPCLIVRDKYDKAAMMSRNVIAGEENHWPNGVIPYAFGNDFPEEEKQLIFRSMKNIEDNSGVRYVPRCSFHNNYVNITHDQEGCFVRGLGYHPQRGAQRLNLKRPGCMRYDIIVHELMHSLGFLHEQNRPDRDDYVNIFWDNIRQAPLYYYQFARAKFPDEDLPRCDISKLIPHDDCYNGDIVTTYGLPYDFQSVMHYFATAFSRNGNATMLAKNFIGEIGAVPDVGLTSLDIQKLKRTYPDSLETVEINTDCSATTLTDTTTTTTTTTTTSTTTTTTSTTTTTTTTTKTTTTTTKTTTTTTKTTTTTSTTTTTNTIEPCISVSGLPCIFPFSYRGEKYTRCTTKDNGGQTWCAVRSLYENGEAHYYSNCPDSCPGESTSKSTECTTTSGKPCVFPFTYRQSQFTKCTTIDNFGQPWCATAVNDATNVYTEYGICDKSCEVMPTVEPSTCQTTSGLKCVFPFKYGGTTYSRCTDVDYPETMWCATATNANGEYNGNYGICGTGC